MRFLVTVSQCARPVSLSFNYTGERLRVPVRAQLSCARGQIGHAQAEGEDER